jgi:hypothetical protein
MYKFFSAVAPKIVMLVEKKKSSIFRSPNYGFDSEFLGAESPSNIALKHKSLEKQGIAVK